MIGRSQYVWVLGFLWAGAFIGFAQDSQKVVAVSTNATTAPLPKPVVIPPGPFSTMPEVAGAGCTNSLGMRFVPVGTEGLYVSTWETRMKDYTGFIKATGRPWPKPDFSQTADHPAVNVNWEDAIGFCRWITEKETQSGRLLPGWQYRLPTDSEWNVAVGLSASDLKAKVSEALGETLYPWGGDWPPPQNAGNYHPELGIDKFPYTSPVGSFKPNAWGLYDMGGNVWEWCMDRFNESDNFRVLRGSSWRLKNPADLMSTVKVGNTSDLRLSTYGFRCVIAPVPANKAP
jgi:formylglycine-generating enzyme required for sulfatase activity